MHTWVPKIKRKVGITIAQLRKSFGGNTEIITSKSKKK